MKIETFEVKAEQGRRVGVLHFNAVSERPVDVRIGHSFISHKQAMHNLKVELGSRPFEELGDSAEDVGNERQGRIQVEGRSETQRQTFYSALYRTSLFRACGTSQMPQDSRSTIARIAAR
jgi:putative alpha-1,2-mannosidase